LEIANGSSSNGAVLQQNTYTGKTQQIRLRLNSGITGVEHVSYGIWKKHNNIEIRHIL
jgi:hypothetical protein